MDIRLPSLGEGADSGVVVNLLVKEGDAVQKDQPILELETEKAVGTIPSPVDGTVQGIRVKVGDKLSVGQVILTLAGAEAVAPAPVAPVAVTVVATPHHVPGLPVAASPTVRRLARELGIDLNRISNAGTFNPTDENSLRADIDGNALIDSSDLNAAWANRAQRTDTLAAP